MKAYVMNGYVVTTNEEVEGYIESILLTQEQENLVNKGYSVEYIEKQLVFYAPVIQEKIIEEILYTGTIEEIVARKSEIQNINININEVILHRFYLGDVSLEDNYTKRSIYLLSKTRTPQEEYELKKIQEGYIQIESFKKLLG